MVATAHHCRSTSRPAVRSQDHRPARRKKLAQGVAQQLNGWGDNNLVRATGTGPFKSQAFLFTQGRRIGASDQVARLGLFSIFDAKQGAASRLPGTKLTPTYVGTCRRNSWSGESLRRKIGHKLEITCQECARNFQMSRIADY